MGASDRYCLRWNNHHQNFLTVMDDLLQNQTLTDVTLGVEDGRFLKCHKIILATCSSYFRSLFIDVPCKHPIVVLKDVKYTEIKAILDFMYKGEVSVAREEMTDLLKVAELLKVKGLVSGNELSSATPPQSPPTAICSTSNERDTSAPPSSDNYPVNSTRPHSTSSPFCSSAKSPSYQDGVEAKISIPPWPIPQVSPPEDQRSVGSFAKYHSFLATRQSLLFSHFENVNDATTSQNCGNIFGNGTIKQQDTGILRTVLNQHYDDVSYPNRSNGSANNESDERRSSMDLSQGNRAQSPYETDASMMDEDEKRHLPQTLPEDTKIAATSYSLSQKQEGKRYKKYTRNDIWNAIEAVKGGLSANKAAELFSVPSRTLYDKIKKLGIVSTKHSRRSENVRVPGFSYDIVGNVSGGVCDNNTKILNETSSLSGAIPSALVATTFSETHENLTDRELTMEIDRRNSSPRVSLDIAHVPPPEESSFLINENDEAEDLSVSRRTNVRVIISPKTAVTDAT